MKLLLCLVPGLLLAQSDWVVPPRFAAAGYRQQTTPEGIALSGPGPSGALTQTFDAAPYRGQAVRLRASVRLEGQGRAQLQLRVDRAGGKLGFFDNMGDRPVVSTEWQPCEIVGEVGPDAESIEVGVLSAGAATVQVKEISFERLPQTAETAADRETIRDRYARVDDAFGAGNVDAIAALATADAEIVLPSGRLALATSLAQIRGSRFQSHSEVTAIRVAGAEATVWVNNETAGGAQAVFSSNRDLWQKTAGGWKMRRSTVIATRAVTPKDVLAEIPGRAGLPDWQGVRIVVCDCRSAPAIAGFPVISADVDPRGAAARAHAYLEAREPEESQLATLAFQENDAARLAAVVRRFDGHSVKDAAWMAARHDALIVYQALTTSNEERLAAHILWLASEAHPAEKFLVIAPAAVLPALRQRYGKQVYAIGDVPRELLGGDYFVDLASAPADSALGRWLAAQKLPYDGVMGQ